VGFKCLAQGCDQMFTVFSFIKRPRFLENGDPFFNAGVGRGGGGVFTAWGTLPGWAGFGGKNRVM